MGVKIYPVSGDPNWWYLGCDTKEDVDKVIEVIGGRIAAGALGTPRRVLDSEGGLLAVISEKKRPYHGRSYSIEEVKESYAIEPSFQGINEERIPDTDELRQVFSTYWGWLEEEQ